MGYVRFENTLRDLRDCFEHMEEDDLSPSERNYRDAMVKLCDQISAEYGTANDTED